MHLIFSIMINSGEILNISIKLTNFINGVNLIPMIVSSLLQFSN